MRYYKFFIILILIYLSVFAGQYSNSDFSITSLLDTTNVVINGSNKAYLDTSKTVYIQLLKDEKLTTNNTPLSYSTSVVSVPGLDYFRFFWVENIPNNIGSSDDQNTVYWREFRINSDGYTSTISYNTSSRVATDTLLKFVDPIMTSSSAFFVSVGDGNRFLELYKTNSKVILSPNFVNSRYGAIAELPSGNIVDFYYTSTVKKLGAIIDAGGNKTEITINDWSGNQFDDWQSVAVDASGNVLVTIATGRGGLKAIRCFLYDSNLSYKDDIEIATGVSLAASDFGYKDAPIVSYADTKFVIAYWKDATNQVYYRTVDVAGVSPALTLNLGTEVSVASGSSFQSPAIATNNSQLLVAWKNITNSTVEGMRIPINTGVIGANTVVEKFSDASTTVEMTFRPILNVALTDNGSSAYTWRQGDTAVGSIWSNAGIRYPTGVWTSKVDSVPGIAGDSVIFMPGAYTSTLNGGTTSCEYRTGVDNNYGAWTSGWSATITDSISKSVNQYFQYRFNLGRDNVDTMKTPYINSVTVNWNVKPRIIRLDSVRNSGVLDPTVTSFADTLDLISHTEVGDIFFTVYDADTESVYISSNWPIDPTLATDTVSGTVYMDATIKLNPTTVWDSVYSLILTGQDARGWSFVSPSNFTVRARKAAPYLTAVEFNGDTIANNTDANIVIGSVCNTKLYLERSQIVSWNALTYRFTTARFDTSFTVTSGSSVDSLLFTIDSSDYYMRVKVTDAFGSVDSSRINFIFPQYDISDSLNPNYLPAFTKLADSLSFLLHVDSVDTVVLPIFNSGNDTLSIDSIYFTGHLSNWLTIGVPQGASTLYFNHLGSDTNISTIYMLPDSSSLLTFTIDVSAFVGDGVLYDTVIIFVNDPINSSDTIPIMIEYNDAPQITSFGYDYLPGTPHRSMRNGSSNYNFPPHARLKYTFSEPIDSASAEGLVWAYSVYDSTKSFAVGTSKIDTINLTNEWNSTYTQLFLSPRYTVGSTYFDSILPPAGYFIPTDSLRLYLNSSITDQAITPTGPNRLDINGDFIPDNSVDTMILVRVDSITFTVDSVTPINSSTDILSSVVVEMFFSDQIYPGTVDTSKQNNRSLVIKTGYNSSIDTLRQIIFDTVYTVDNRAVFVPAKAFFYGDSVFCYYRGATIRDTLGYGVDINGDGLPATLFDSTSQAEDLSWSFKIRDISLSKTIPDSAAIEILRAAPIVLSFSNNIVAGIIDTTLVGNRTLTVTSLYSEGDTLPFDSVRISGADVSFYLRQNLFYADSVNCQFHGLISKDSTNFFVDITGDTLFVSGKSHEWYYRVETLKLSSVSPDSASSTADVNDRINLIFSGPVSSLIVDTNSIADSNQSFYFITSYSGGNKMPYNSVEISSNGLVVSIEPEKAFFSNDSVFCYFRGYRSGYSYANPSSIIPAITDTGSLGEYRWYFHTARTQFYSFPNPYSPAKDSRHLAQGGIMFKNLHAIKKGNNAVTIKVFSINSNTVFTSKQIIFEEGSEILKPQWLWNCKNNRGVDVASGVYLYIIYDKNMEPLLKGKLMIVR